MKGFLLTVPVLLPLMGGGILLLAKLAGHRRIGGKCLERVTLGVVSFNSLLVLLLLCSDMWGRRVVLFRLYSNLSVMFKLDLMGGFFAGLIAVLWPLATLYSLAYMREEKRKGTFFAYYVMTYGVTLGIALAGNLVTLYIFYEMLTLVTFPLVLFPLSREAVLASRTYLYYSIGGAAFAFIGIIFVLVFSSTGTSEFIAGGILSTQAMTQQRDMLLLVYVLAFFGFGVKAALLPCYVWLPRATVAPTPVTALLHAVAVVKSGAFAVMRFTYFSFGASFLRGSWAQYTVMAAALLTILFGSTMAVKEIHWKRRLAYSTVSNLSYILFGAAIMTPFGLAAALCHMAAHAFMKICSFFCAGAVMHQTGKNYVYELDGLGKRMPATFGCLTVASLSLMGIPLFAGFVSKWNLCGAALSYGSSIVEEGKWGAFLPVLGVAVILYSALMTAVYMLSVLVRAYFPRVSEGSLKTAETEENDVCANCDPGWEMLVPLFIFAGVILFMGLYPGPFLELFGRIGGAAA